MLEQPLGLLQGGGSGPVVVAVHGARSTAANMMANLRSSADAWDRTLLAPSFDPIQHRGYQQLGSASEPLGAARAFDLAIRQRLHRLGRSGEAVDLIGFSGGAQFAHRYAMLFPSRVRTLIVVAAGWYTRLEATDRFPLGVKACQASGELCVDIDRFLAIPTMIAVGERDVEHDRLLRGGEVLNAIQGEHRLARAVRWWQHLGAVARERNLPDRSCFVLLPATGHSLRTATTRGGLGEAAMNFISLEESDRERIRSRLGAAVATDVTA